jgi:hypothetical protein
MRRVWCAAGLACVMSVSAHAEAQRSEPAIQNITTAKVHECGTFAELYLRMADLRDLGAEEGVAVNRGVHFMSGVGRTGSHLPGRNFRPSVERFARFIYANPQLKREALYMRGLYSCVLSKLIAGDDAHDRAQAAFDSALGRCQAQHPEAADVRALGDCASGAAEAVAQQALAKK